ncbi:hypothetical protein WAF17_16590 [Bernardetia sp. ABR2-2B]|uniref:hypothetical protein n=1 Tax=Bernardetia sp. ABR2-2B TaxID=3127472 RepID=UPI0030D260A2
MGLDIYFGKIAKPNTNKSLHSFDNNFTTLEYEEMEICMNVSNSRKTFRTVTDINATAKKSNQINHSGYDFCKADEVICTKKGLFRVPYLDKKVKFEDLVEYQKEFFLFWIKEVEFDLSYWFLTTKFRLDIPFIYTRETALSLVPFLKSEYIYLKEFLENFKTGVHIIYFSY